MVLRSLACVVVLLLLAPAVACSASDGPTQQAANARAPGTRFVLVVSIDGLNPHALRRLGPRGAPHFHRLVAQGASTLNARTEVERTMTLPNHTGMLTGRRVNRRHGGHGVFFNRDNGRRVQRAAGHSVASVFSSLHHHGLRTALFTSKSKFRLYQRSWPHGIDRFTVRLNNRRLVDAVRADLTRHPRPFTFVHLSLPDAVGHEKGFMSPAYLRAVRSTDRRIGELMAIVRRSPRLRQHLTLLLTADHGGRGNGHRAVGRLANHRVPFLAWGAGVARGRDLYSLNPGFANPRQGRPLYAASRQPIRNGDIANVATSLLGHGPVPGSEHNRDQSLRVG